MCKRILQNVAPEDFEEVMTNNTGTETVEAIYIVNPPNLQISKKALKSMNRLRMLGIKVSEAIDNEDAADIEDEDGISLHDDTFKFLSNNLRCFIWDYYPGKSLLANFEPKRLVHLQLYQSSLCHLWKGTKNLSYLRELHLNFSERLIQTPDFRGMPNLEILVLRYCSALEDVHPSLPWEYIAQNSFGWICLLAKASRAFHVLTVNLLNIWIYNVAEGSGIRELPSSIFQYRTHTTKLYLRSLENLVTLPNSICMLKSLKFLYLQGCSELESLPEEIGDMENLEEFDASFTLIYRPPSSIVRLNKLKKLNFAKGELEEREATVHFVFPRVKEGLRSLEELDLSYCNLIDGQLLEDIGCLSSLKELYLKGNNFDHLPQSIVQLGTLQVLDVSNCERLIELPELPPNVGR